VFSPALIRAILAAPDGRTTNGAQLDSCGQLLCPGRIAAAGRKPPSARLATLSVLLGRLALYATIGAIVSIALPILADILGHRVPARAASLLAARAVAEVSGHSSANI